MDSTCPTGDCGATSAREARDIPFPTEVALAVLLCLELDAGTFADVAVAEDAKRMNGVGMRHRPPPLDRGGDALIDRQPIRREHEQ
jgi:hypothetical protein